MPLCRLRKQQRLVLRPLPEVHDNPREGADEVPHAVELEEALVGITWDPRSVLGRVHLAVEDVLLTHHR